MRWYLLSAWTFRYCKRNIRIWSTLWSHYFSKLGIVHLLMFEHFFFYHFYLSRFFCVYWLRVVRVRSLLQIKQNKKMKRKERPIKYFDVNLMQNSVKSFLSHKFTLHMQVKKICFAQQLNLVELFLVYPTNLVLQLAIFHLKLLID